MTYCGHFQQGGAWPCTVDERGDEMPDLLRALSLTESALRAYEQGADRDQLSEYLAEIHTALGGEDVPIREDAEGAQGTLGAQTGDAPPGDADAPAAPRLPPE